ncbi:MAG: hypothetical protein ACEQSC_00535 [Candidatus Nanopelagicaceae bacterium]
METDNTEPHKNWIPETISESFDGIAQVAPILQTNRVGAILTLAFLTTTTICAATLIVVWRSPSFDFNSIPHNLDVAESTVCLDGFNRKACIRKTP